MTDLQLGLLVIGVLAVIGVLIYNRVQEGASARRAQRTFASAHADVLLDSGTGRREPTLEAAAPRHQSRAPEIAQALPDPAIDYVVELALARPVAATSAAEQWAALEHRFAGRALFAGFDGSSRRRVTAGVPGTFEALQAGLQLVSRAGTVGEAELIEFRSEVETMAARLGARVTAPPMRDAIEAAQQLDAFCVDADIQVALHVVATSGAFPAEALQEALAREADAPFRVLPSGDGALTLTLDMPRTPDPMRAYEAMARAALHLGTALGGALRDDNGRPLDERALAAIASQVEAVRKALEERGIEPGGTLALRLFS